ncbi:HutD/Ves family protein [Bordetella genomosp. 12]|uniref:Histidine utilization protein HutD n=1 Tax=Bordetella genomosp. 12 TaxID=463035 RepID=A0A261VV84_9BORD|nr:HutD family protein [Bordetella genomosp. 12]OZI78008.1 histidine utilization protein HutD [Bordetella genomosp. 12]
MTLHFFDTATVAATPWRNGGGTTRELACFPAGAAMDNFAWRISIADIAADGPFSAFPGVDRVITLLDGDGVRLSTADGQLDHRLDTPLAPFAFAGEAPIVSTLLGGHTRDFNVMTRRQGWQAEVSILRSAATLAACDGGLLYACGGSWAVNDTAALQAGQGAYWTARAVCVALAPASPDAALIAVRLIRVAGASA